MQISGPPPPSTAVAATTITIITPITSVDKNGVLYLQPLEADGYKLSYSNETFTFNKNFRSDGSMRMDFEDRVRDSGPLAGYFKITQGPDGEEVSAKMNGGPHNDTNATWADTMDFGITNFAGTKSRVRWEKTHPNYSKGISSGPGSQMPIGDIRNKWMGFAGLKVNLDTSGHGKPDKVALIGMVDVGGLESSSGNPKNDWKITYKRIFSPNEIELKSVFTPYVSDWKARSGSANNKDRSAKAKRLEGL